MRKKTPDTSKLSRTNAAPYTLRKTEPSATTIDVAKRDKTDADVDVKKEPKVVDAKALAAASDGKVDAKFDDVKSGAVPVEPHDGAPKPGDGAKSATHNELPTEPPAEAKAEEPDRARAETMGMPPIAVGAPPEMPAAPVTKGTVEDPTNMPTAKNVPTGNPTDPALPPGRVPAGDSRSFRRGDEYALVYRQGTCVITRFGTVGQRGQWRVVEYPTSASASNSYAKECSRFVAEGFSDYRD
jgi:hypothetical protein